MHGRTKEQKGHRSGPCDWGIIRAVKEHLRIPVLANGGLRKVPVLSSHTISDVNLWKHSDIEACFNATKCDAVMSADAMQWNPAFFSGKPVNNVDLMLEYLGIVKEHPDPLRIPKVVYGHAWGMFLLHNELVY